MEPACKDTRCDTKPPKAAGKATTDSGDSTAKKTEKAAYAGVKFTDDVCLIFYLSQSGYTLTDTLNFVEGGTVGVASNEKTWIPMMGLFDVLR